MATFRAVTAVATVLAALINSANVSAADFDHVRSNDEAIRELLRTGYERSATFRTLVDRIDQLPGIVYIQPVVKMSRGMDAGLLHVVSGSPKTPILRVSIRTGLAGDYAIGVLAHELQHVVEVLTRTDLFDSRAMRSLFDALDAHDRSPSGVFETDEARAVAARVLEELHSRG